MSFGKLLAAGKSWVGGDGVGRYRMRKHIRLPKFISPRNPFKLEVGAEALVSPVAPPPRVAGVGAAAPANEVSWRARGVAGFRRLVGSFREWNPISRIGLRRASAIARYGRSGIQGELSLDKVKVVRGDLAHTDLEAIPVGSSGNRVAGPAWKNLTARMVAGGLK